jgi:hypothetical protein
LQFIKLPARIVNNRTFKGIAAAKIKDKLSLEILKDNRLINLIKLAILEKKVDILGEITLNAIFLSAGGYNKYI